MVTVCFVQFMQSVCELAILPFAHGCQSRVRAVRTRKGSALPWTVFRVTHPTLPGTCARLCRIIHNINPTLLYYLSIEAPQRRVQQHSLVDMLVD